MNIEVWQAKAGMSIQLPVDDIAAWRLHLWRIAVGNAIAELARDDKLMPGDILHASIKNRDTPDRLTVVAYVQRIGGVLQEEPPVGWHFGVKTAFATLRDMARRKLNDAEYAEFSRMLDRIEEAQ